MKRPNVVMVGPGLNVPGGISAVVNHWLDAGLADLVDLRYVPTLDAEDAGSRLRKLRSAIRACCAFVRQCSTRPVDVVHIHLSVGASFYRKLLIFRLAGLRSLKTVVHLHGSTFQEFYRHGGPLRARLIRSFFDDADAVIVLSASWKAFVCGITRNPNVHILHNGAMTSAFGARQDNGSQVVIASMGRLGQRKGTWDLIEAFRRLASEVPGARLVLGGDGEIEKAASLVERHGLSDKVTITGWVTGESKLEIFSRADVYALPSYHEGLPASILEAMAAGAPIVSTPVGGIPEAVMEGENGFLIQPGDIDALRERLRRLCCDSALRERMGRRSKQLIDEGFDLHRLVLDLTDLYRRTLTSGGSEREAAPRPSP